MYLQGVARARDSGFLVVKGSAWYLDSAEYEHYEQVCVLWGEGGSPKGRGAVC